jgi:hypothetical protein
MMGKMRLQTSLSGGILKVTKSAYYFRYVCPSILPRASVRLSLKEFP